MKQLNLNNPIYNQDKLHIISERTMDKLEELLSILHVDLKYSRHMYYGCCPVHGGDKWNALNIFHNGDTYRGNWKCHSMQCEQYFRNSIIGFVRGVLSHQKYGWAGPNDKTVSFNETVEFLLSFIKEDYDSLKVNTQSVDRNRFAQQTLKNVAAKKVGGITRKQIRASLKLPSSYYIKRGYTAQILDNYDVGECNKKGTQMYGRVVVPIYDNSYKYMVGCTGRSLFEKCPHCKTWHGGNCPSDDTLKKYPMQFAKWRHSKGFRGEDYLYNYWKAKKNIRRTGVAILVESPGNVWRLEEAGIHNSVGLFGTSLTIGQQLLLDTSGALSLILLTDNDKAGILGVEAIREKCGRIYHLYVPKLDKNDVGDMSVLEVKQEIKPIIDKVIEEMKI